MPAGRRPERRAEALTSVSVTSAVTSYREQDGMHTALLLFIEALTNIQTGFPLGRNEGTMPWTRGLRPAVATA